MEATGRDCPECFDTFEELMEIEALAESKAAKQMLANIKRSGFTNPTPVQKWYVLAAVLSARAADSLSAQNFILNLAFLPGEYRSLPIALASRDLMACAQTGSGKTGGFLFPLILRTDFLDNRRLRKPSPSSLILVRTLPQQCLTCTNQCSEKSCTLKSQPVHSRLVAVGANT